MSDTLRSKEGKLRINILPILGLEEVMKVGEFGAKKHSEFGYKQGFPISYFINAAFRHIFLEFLIKGMNKDEESGLHPLAHGAWNILAALEQMIIKPELDDREKLGYKDKEESTSEYNSEIYSIPIPKIVATVKGKIDFESSLNDKLKISSTSPLFDPNRESGAV